MRNTNSPLRRAVESEQWLWLLAILGTVVRLGFVLHAGSAEHFYDELNYDSIGLHIAHGLGFQTQWGFTAYRAPGQPLLIGAVFALFGHRVIAVRAVQAVLLAILPFLVSRLGVATGLNRFQANLAAFLAAFHPALAYASATLYPTVLTTVALTWGVWLCLCAARKRQVGSAVLGGVALGIAGAATTTFVPVAFLAGAVLAIRRQFRAGLIVAVIGTLPALLWMVRNEYRMHAFTIATDGGQNLALGANDLATPLSGNFADPAVNPELMSEGEVRADHIWRRQAEDWIRAHPERYAELAVLRGALVFNSRMNTSTGRPIAKGVALLVEDALLPFALLALVGLYLYRRELTAWLTMCALSLIIVSSALTICKPRFRLPCDPLLAVFAVGAVVQIYKRLASHPASPREEITASRPRV